MAVNVLALCAGYGGLERGVARAMPGATPVAFVEREAYAAATLVARMADGSLDPAPIWSDLRTFDGTPWRGLVDLVTAGYPCKGESDAGKRTGTNHEFWLWPEVWRVIREVGPGLVFLENVAAHVGRSFRHVLGDLAASRWRVEWDCFPAAAVGAPHLRDRVFILAANPDLAGIWKQSGRPEPGPSETESVLDGEACDATDPDEFGREEQRLCGVLDCIRPTLGHHTHRRSGEVSDADCRRLPQRIRVEIPAGKPGAGLIGDFWSGGTSAEPAVCRVDDGGSCWVDLRAYRLHMLGNGVVDRQAECAFRALWGRLVA